MKNQGCDMGLIGLGVMGRNLVLNIADQGFSVAVYNRTIEKTQAFIKNEARERDIRGGYNLKEFTSLLRKPRAIVMLVKAGPSVDAVIENLLPHLEHGDLLIDGGNSHFPDTNRRNKSLAEKGFFYLGMGILIGNWVKRLTQGATKERPFIANLAKAAIVVFALAIALRSLGIADEIVTLAFGLLLGSIAIAAAIAFGIGSREIAGREVEAWVKKLKRGGK